MPPGLAGRLPKLREVKLDGNLLEGNVLELLMYSRTMDVVQRVAEQAHGAGTLPGSRPCGRRGRSREAVSLFNSRMDNCTDGVFCLQMRIK